MIRIAIAIGLALQVALAGASVIPERHPLSTTVAIADVVAEVRVTKILPHRFNGNGRTETCGIDYVVDVLQTLKGEHRPQRTFSIIGQPHAIFEHTVKPGEQMLVLLQPRKQGAAPSGYPADVIRGTPSREELNCRGRLGDSTLVGGERAGFPILSRSTDAKSGSQSLWIAYTRSTTELPKPLTSQQIFYDVTCNEEICARDGRRMIPWEPLKVEIQRWIREAEQTGAGKKIDGARQEARSRRRDYDEATTPSFRVARVRSLRVLH